MSARDHLAANTTKQPDGCWLWTGSVLPGGYGVTNYEGKRFYVHRLSYEAHIGSLPEGMGCVLSPASSPGARVIRNLPISRPRFLEERVS